MSRCRKNADLIIGEDASLFTDQILCDLLAAKQHQATSQLA